MTFKPRGFGHTPLPPSSWEAAFSGNALLAPDRLAAGARGHGRMSRKQRRCFRTGSHDKPLVDEVSTPQRQTFICLVLESMPAMKKRSIDLIPTLFNAGKPGCPNIETNLCGQNRPSFHGMSGLPGRCGVSPLKGVTENDPRLRRGTVAGRGKAFPPIETKPSAGGVRERALIRIVTLSNVIPHPFHSLGVPRMLVVTNDRLLAFNAAQADRRDEVLSSRKNPD